ncbi:MAG: transporter substrate-binding domain-containing protein [Bacteroidales bacterium]|jgi:PAS domain S-box-containing protein|nr:transporter substrate-binding domain-containing protein [Bacteroidales bacterium]
MAKIISLIFMLFAALFQPGDLFAQVHVVGGDYDYAPFSFITKTGNPSGLEVDVLEAIAASGDLELSYHLSRWGNAIANIQSGKTDIIVGIIFSEEREKHLDFTIPIHTEYYSIFIRKDLPFEDLSSLYDYKPAVLDKDVSIEKYLVPMGLLNDSVLAISIPDAFSAIELGLADYVLAPNLVGLYEIEKNNYQNIEIKGPSIIPSIYCMAVKKGDTQLLNILNDGISELRRNGKLAEIQEKWRVYEPDDHSNREIARNIWIVFVIAVGLFILVFIWVWLLRRQIKKQTESINLKNRELQKSEEKFRIITENSSDIIWHLDSNFILTYISPADERIRGFNRKEVIGKSLFSILKPEGIEMLKEANKKRMADLSKGIRLAPGIYELEEVCKDGSYVWVEASATAIYDQDGKIFGYHGVSRDISERKKAELLLKERESQLRELNSTKDKLFSIIAHDLRSPFNVILGFTEQLIENIKDFELAESEKYLQIINLSAKNTLVLLDNLLHWSKTQTGKNIYKPEKIHLSEIVREILELSKSLAKIKDISLEYTYNEDFEVYADVNMLKTILRNLISNAIKYTHSNGKIVISAVQNQNNIEITVTDNGVGMSEENRSKLFKIDTNITTPGTANEKGSGLGLILCKEFVEKHGGKIWAESEEGKGSTFYFTLSCNVN